MTRFSIDPNARRFFAALPAGEQRHHLERLRASTAAGHLHGELVASYRAALMPNADDYCPTLDPRDDRQWSCDVLDLLLEEYP